MTPKFPEGVVANATSVFTVSSTYGHAAVPLNTEFSPYLAASGWSGIINFEETGRRLKRIEADCVGHREPVIPEPQNLCRRFSWHDDVPDFNDRMSLLTRISVPVKVEDQHAVTGLDGL
jgi:hypothetical protein